MIFGTQSFRDVKEQFFQGPPAAAQIFAGDICPYFAALHDHGAVPQHVDAVDHVRADEEGPASRAHFLH